MIELDHLDDADNLFFVHRVVEKGQIADFHRLHVVRGLMIAYAVPAFALVAFGLLVVP